MCCLETLRLKQQVMLCVSFIYSVGLSHGCCLKETWNVFFFFILVKYLLTVKLVVDGKVTWVRSKRSEGTGPTE